MCTEFRLHRAVLPKEIEIGECWARDGLQNETSVVSTDHKVEMIERFVGMGIKVMEATSFAHPKMLPQFADAEEVLKRIPRKAGVRYRAICTTMKAVERAIASKEAGYGVDEIVMVISTSEPHNFANVNMSHKENKELCEKMTRMALDTGHAVFGWALTAFGCPIAGDVKPAAAIALGNWWKDVGATIIGFGDTIGSSNPVQVSNFYEYALSEGYTTDEVVVHFHDTRGWGVANSMVALTYGFTHFDTSFGAIGGQPRTGAAEYQHGFAGNTCTEDLVGMFEEMGVSCGLDQQKMIATGRRAEEILGHKCRSNYIVAGPVVHGGIEYDKEKGILA
ncbi:MAG: hydroxymethylglutaryl-CoA lyase [Deferrisomatales bacterium]|nr:hydroxymethylglutaryl-CoA lyase [Deferrisomatales bacterium]